MAKILFIVPHRLGRSPGQRFRFEQYLEHLKSNGFDYKFSYLINEKDDAIFYAKGKYVSKFLILLKCIFIRICDVYRAKDYDIIFIYREAVMFGATIFEKMLAKRGAKVVLDFDDAIWLMDVSDGNKNLQWLKKPSKTATLIKYSNLIIVGNKYLADYALQYNKSVEIIPTTLITDYYVPSNSRNYNNAHICIGWTGSSTTIKHLETATPILKKIKEKFPNVYFKVISDVIFTIEGLEIKNCKWTKESEVADLEEIDIGIMPLPDDKWTKGKCGFKGLQYMAMEIPAVMSPVGVNTEIIEDGVNGFLAASEEQWIEKLSILISNSDLRKKLGENGRKTVINRFSFTSQKDKYVNILNNLICK